ncbi:unnamed protein product [Pylaiella littoralis]
MPRRATRPVALAVKEEVIDREEIDRSSSIVATLPAAAAAVAASSKDEPKSLIGRVPTKALRGDSVADTGAGASPCSSPALSSRFFPSPSFSAARGRKRKAAGGGCGSSRGDSSMALPSVRSGPRQAVAVHNRAKKEEGGGRGGFAGDDSPPHTKKSLAPQSAQIPTAGFTIAAAAATSQRRSSRFNMVKKEELGEGVDFPEYFPPAACASARRARGSEQRNPFTSIDRESPRRRAVAAAIDEEGVQQTQKKQEDKGKKVPRKVKIKTQGVGEKLEERPIPPRLAEKAALIVQVMDKLYPDPPIPINHVDSFTLLCGVLLSAQTTDAQVNLVTQELFRAAPNPQALSKMAHEDVQQIIRHVFGGIASVGLAPTKAKHLIALSQQLLDRFDGKVPRTFDGLQSLPGVGRKTAAVVMVQAFETPAFPVDTHIHRLALRWGLTKNEKNATKVEEDLMAIFPRDSWARLHLQFIYFGREHCQARVHDISACPICCWVKKTGPSAPKALSELSCLRDYLASPTPPKKSSKNAIVYSERMLEMEQVWNAMVAKPFRTKI